MTVDKGLHPQPKGKPSFANIDFAHTPFIVFWEMTKACALACRHCRAVAQPKRNPMELTTDEGLRLLGEIADMGTPLMVLTGGDPLMRPDLLEFIKYSNDRGMRVSLAPSATHLVTSEIMSKAKDSGLARASISVDGSNADIHDAFRRTPGSFDRTMKAIEAINAAGVSIQINTSVSRYNLSDLNNMVDFVIKYKAVMWDVFFIVPTGRGQLEDMITSEQHEETFNWLYDLSKRAHFDIKTTAAEHYRRVSLQRRQAESSGQNDKELKVSTPGFHHVDSIGRASKGVNDGNGCCFISHIGEVYPSGFLPLIAGNVRQQSIIDIYRKSPLFLELRDTGRIKGKCGRCEYKNICGGSRARAYAVTGDYMAEEPKCVYQPKGNA